MNKFKYIANEQIRMKHSGKIRKRFEPQIDAKNIETLSDTELVAININKPVIEVNHKDLERTGETSIYRSSCPVCIRGSLLVMRNSKTGELEEYDNCILCGQTFRYNDIDEMRNG